MRTASDTGFCGEFVEIHAIQGLFFTCGEKWFSKNGTFLLSKIALDLCKDVKNLFAVYFSKKKKSFSPVSLRSKQLIRNWLAVGCCASWQPCLRASAFTCLCVAWLGMVEARKEQRSWTRTAFIKGDDVEMESFQNLDLPAG